MRRRKMPPARPPSTSTGEGPRDGWGSMFRVTALCLLVSVAVFTILPRAAEGGTAIPSALFADVRVPAEVVPVSVGRPIGSIAGSTFDAQVSYTLQVLAYREGVGVSLPESKVGASLRTLGRLHNAPHSWVEFWRIEPAETLEAGRVRVLTHHERGGRECVAKGTGSG